MSLFFSVLLLGAWRKGRRRKEGWGREGRKEGEVPSHPRRTFSSPSFPLRELSFEGREKDASFPRGYVGKEHRALSELPRIPYLYFPRSPSPCSALRSKPRPSDFPFLSSLPRSPRFPPTHPPLLLPPPHYPLPNRSPLPPRSLVHQPLFHSSRRHPFSPPHSSRLPQRFPLGTSSLPLLSPLRSRRRGRQSKRSSQLAQDEVAYRDGSEGSEGGEEGVEWCAVDD